MSRSALKENPEYLRGWNDADKLFHLDFSHGFVSILARSLGLSQDYLKGYANGFWDRIDEDKEVG